MEVTNFETSLPLTVELSDDTLTPFKRKAFMVKFDWDAVNRIIQLNLMVAYYEKNEDGTYGEILQSSRFQPYERRLVVSDLYIVDEQGNVVTEPEEGVDYATEYEFYLGLAGQAVVILDVMEQAIVIADQNGRLN